MRKQLTFSLLFFLVLYHGLNLFYPLRNPLAFSKGLLEIKLHNKIVLNIPAVVNVSETGKPIDFTSTLITYTARKLNPWEVGQGEVVSMASYQSPEETEDRVVKDMRIVVAKVVSCGANIILLPVPARRTVLGISTLPREALAFYKKALLIDPKHTLNLYDPFRKHILSNPDASLFEPDNHWVSLGIALAAKEIILKLDPLANPKLQMSNSLNVSGVKFASLFFDRQNIRKNLPLYDLKPVHESKKPARVISVGTSFTEKYENVKYDLASVLSRAWGLEAFNLNRPSGGLFGWLEKIEKVKLSKNDLVIWEYPIAAITTGSALPVEIKIQCATPTHH